MKIIYWTNGFWPRLGGMETLALDYIESMQKRGYEFLVLAQKDNDSFLDEEIYRGISIRRFDFNSVMLTVRLVDEYLNEMKQTFKPDLIHLNTVWGGSAFMYLLFHQKLNIPTLMTSHDFCIGDGKLSPSAIKILNAVDKIACVSKAVLHSLKNASVITNRNSVCIHNGLRLPDLYPAPLSFYPPTILCIGRLVQEKGFHVAMHALAQLTNEFPDLRLILAGDGDQRDALLELISSLSLSKVVNYIGSVSISDVPTLMNQATMVVIPSLNEPFGLVAVEAAQMQRPVIAAASGGLPEIIIDNETGLLVPVHDVSALCAAIKKLILNPDLAITLGQNARKHVIENFNIHQLANHYEQAYQDIMEM